MKSSYIHSFFVRVSQGVSGAVVAVALALTVQSGLAQTDSDTQEQMVDISELTIDETLMIPEVPQKQKKYIKGYMKREAQALQKMGYKVETMRKGEVVIATVPASSLFAPNDTLLLPTASDVLKPFLPYFRTHGKFKVILAMHSDNTGSDNYLYSLTEKRILALYGYFDGAASQTDMLQGYPMADSDPLVDTPNNNMANRAKNRRLEIYIVPGPILISEAKTKKL